ncbi:MAG: hypothetical protein ACRDM7_06200 [Thermoleophilaceae bacterium]
MRRALLFAAVGLLVCAPSAQAGPFDKYEAVAVEFFGQRVDCSAPAGVVVIGPAHMEHDFHTQGPVAMAGSCFISVLWPYWRDLDRSSRCLIYLHEYAHLLYGDGDHGDTRLWQAVSGARARRSCAAESGCRLRAKAAEKRKGRAKRAFRLSTC